MADHSKPLVTSTYTNFVTELDGRFDDLALGLDPATTTPTNLPTGAIRWNSASSKWEKWSGTAWADLATAYNINLAGPLTLTANSSSDALRITQTGAGNALVVEDSANPDSSPFVVDGNGSAVLGNTVAIDTGIQTTSGNVFVQKLGTSVNNRWGASLGYWQNNTQAMRLNFAKSRGTAVGTNASVASGDLLGQVEFKGDDGANFIEAASISSWVDGIPGTNDMPCRLVFSTTADGASSPTERLRINSTGVSAFTTAGQFGISIAGTVSGGTTNYGAYCGVTIGSSVTVRGEGFQSALSTQAGGAGLSELGHFKATQGTLGTAVANQYGFLVDSSLTGATNNYGFYSNIASGTGRWNFYAAGTANNYFAGFVGINQLNPTEVLDVEGSARLTSASSLASNSNKIQLGRRRTGLAIVANNDRIGNFVYSGWDGASYIESASIDAYVDGTPSANDMPGRLVFSTTADGASSPTERMRIRSDGNIAIGGSGSGAIPLFIQKPLTGATTSYGISITSTIQSDVTTAAYGIESALGTAAAAFTLSTIKHFRAAQVSLGSGSSVTNQYGFTVENSLTGATNNYGFHSNIASGTGRWNFYAAGTADNYFAGNTGFNKTDPSYIIDINVGSSTDRAVNIYNSDSTLSDGENIHSILFTQNDVSYPNATHAWIKTYAVGSTGGTAMAFATGGSGTATERMRIGTDGQVTLSANAGLTISKTAVTSPAASDGNVFSGTYTPTLTNVTNVAGSTAYQCQYMRVGNVVTVSGQVAIDPTTTGATQLRLSIPVASNFTSGTHASGTAATATTADSARVYADTANDSMLIEFIATSAANVNWSFICTYLVI